MVLFAGSSESGPSAQLHVWKRINTIIQFGPFILSFVCNNDGHICQIIVFWLYCSDLFLYLTKQISTQSSYLVMEEMGQGLIEFCCCCIISPLSWKDLLCAESKNVGFNVYFASKLWGVAFLLYAVEMLACHLSVQHKRSSHSTRTCFVIVTLWSMHQCVMLVHGSKWELYSLIALIYSIIH